MIRICGNVKGEWYEGERNQGGGKRREESVYVGRYLVGRHKVGVQMAVAERQLSGWDDKQTEEARGEGEGGSRPGRAGGSGAWRATVGVPH